MVATLLGYVIPYALTAFVIVVMLRRWDQRMRARLAVELAEDDARFQAELAADRERFRDRLAADRERYAAEQAAEEARFQAELAADDARLGHEYDSDDPDGDPDGPIRISRAELRQLIRDAVREALAGRAEPAAPVLPPAQPAGV